MTAIEGLLEDNTLVPDAETTERPSNARVFVEPSAAFTTTFPADCIEYFWLFKLKINLVS